MGKVAAAAETTTTTKKKGRPSLADLQKRKLQQQQEEHHRQQKTLITSNTNLNSPNRRSTRRNPNLNGISPASDAGDGGNGDDDDDERKEKKVKLVGGLPPSSNHHYPQRRLSANSLSMNSASYGSDLNADGENHEASLNNLEINAANDRSGDFSAADQLEWVQKAMDNFRGSPLGSGPTIPLPEKKFLVFVLDRLQKKDRHGAFSEPVDPDELPDYHEIIGHPMDFQTVRKKLDERRYAHLDEFEADVFLICSNAMEYNAPDTVFFRQARSIRELAKRDFENLRQVNDKGEPQPKIVRRGRPPKIVRRGRPPKESFGSPPCERVGPESSSEATPATGGDNTVGSNSYNHRKGPMSFSLQNQDVLLRACHNSRYNEALDSSEWNSEFPASVLKAEAKYGKKQFSLDENRRETYKQFHPSAFGYEHSVLTTLNGGMKQLMGVGLQSEHGYARSLAQFAANLGPVVWKIASKKIECVLPTGVKFGPGWVGQNEASQHPPFPCPEKKSNNPAYDEHPFGTATISLLSPVQVGLQSEHCTSSAVTYKSSLPSKEDTVQAVSGQHSNSEFAMVKNGLCGIRPCPSFQTQHKHALYSDRAGFNAVSGYDLSSQMGMARVRLSLPTGQSGSEEASMAMPSQTLDIASRSSTAWSTPPMVVNRTVAQPTLPVSYRSKHNENNSVRGTASSESHIAPDVALSGVQPWQGFSWHQGQHSLRAPPDLNVRFQAPGSPSSSFRIGSPQQPDLALQL